MYINQAAGGNIGGIGANQRYKKTNEIKCSIEKSINAKIKSSYEFIISLPAGCVFQNIINNIINNSVEKNVFNFLITNHEYPDFIEILRRNKRIKLINYDINKNVKENLENIKEVDIFLFSDITYDYGIDIYSLNIINEIKKRDDIL